MKRYQILRGSSVFFLFSALSGCQGGVTSTTANSASEGSQGSDSVEASSDASTTGETGSQQDELDCESVVNGVQLDHPCSHSPAQPKNNQVLVSWREMNREELDAKSFRVERYDSGEPVVTWAANHLGSRIHSISPSETTVSGLSGVVYEVQGAGVFDDLVARYYIVRPIEAPFLYLVVLAASSESETQKNAHLDFLTAMLNSTILPEVIL